MTITKAPGVLIVRNGDGEIWTSAPVLDDFESGTKIIYRRARMFVRVEDGGPESKDYTFSVRLDADLVRHLPIKQLAGELAHQLALAFHEVRP